MSEAREVELNLSLNDIKKAVRKLGYKANISKDKVIIYHRKLFDNIIFEKDRIIYDSLDEKMKDRIIYEITCEVIKTKLSEHGIDFEEEITENRSIITIKEI